MPLPCDEITVATSAKLLSAIGGFLGGASILVYLHPKTLKDAAVRIGVSVAASTMLAPVAAAKFFEATAENDSQIVMGCAFFVGFVAWNILGAIAQFFENRQGKDIVQIAKDANPINKIGE